MNEPPENGGREELESVNELDLHLSNLVRLVDGVCDGKDIEGRFDLRGE